MHNYFPPRFKNKKIAAKARAACAARSPSWQRPYLHDAIRLADITLLVKEIKNNQILPIP
jgi:hypothetical protein